MAGNTFGTYFRITTWGESHGKALGVVIDGCPAGFLCAKPISRPFWTEGSGADPVCHAPEGGR